MAEWGSAFAISGHNSRIRPQSRLSRDAQKSLKTQLETAAKEGRVYDIIQLSLRILTSSNLYDHMISNLSDSLRTAFSNFNRLNNVIQSNNIVALREAFAVACGRGQLNNVMRLSHVVRNDVVMMGIGLHFALLQRYGRKRKHWDIIRWLMEHTKLRENPLVLRQAFVEACHHNELEEVRWMLHYRELARDTETINDALRNACSHHLALVKCLVEHADVDVNRTGRVGTLLHDVIWMNKRPSDLHYVCYSSSSDAADVYRLVYECGANVNEQYNRGNTPLHLACYYGREDLVEALMGCGADVNITNDDKRTPAQAAMTHMHKELLPLLDRTILMDTLRRRQQKLRLKKCISVNLTALFVHSISRSKINFTPGITEYDEEYWKV